jgi:hypothetical protein
VFLQAVATGFGLQFAGLPCIDSMCENKQDSEGCWWLGITDTTSISVKGKGLERPFTGKEER